MVPRKDTIFALSTAAGRAGVAVVRVSGPDSEEALSAIAGCVPAPREAVLADMRTPDGGERIDRGLVIRFQAPKSFTGEDIAEFHLHGSRAAIAGLLDALGGLPGLRPADPGEFARRAFDNGKLDLSEVEGLADLIDAETAAQRRQALRQMGGALGRQVSCWRERLLRALAYAEAAIDFPDEELPAGLGGDVSREIESVAGEIGRTLADRRTGERLRDGLQIAIVGPPNAGKSSLLNALAKRDAAIVSEVAGTTRDVVEVHLDLSGYPVTLADTAGLRALPEDDPADQIEREGMRRARARADEADLVLAVFDLTRWPDPDRSPLALLGDRGLVLLNKVDLAPAPDVRNIEGHSAMAVSAKTGAGMDSLVRWLAEQVVAIFPAGEAAPLITRARHRAALEACRDALARAAGAIQIELAAEDLRLAVRELGRITGAVDVEDILDVIFRDFCIGK